MLDKKKAGGEKFVRRRQYAHFHVLRRLVEHLQHAKNNKVKMKKGGWSKLQTTTTTRLSTLRNWIEKREKTVSVCACGEKNKKNPKILSSEKHIYYKRTA